MSEIFFSDPNNDVEVLSGGPFDSGAGEPDTDYGFLFPRVRVFLVPVSSRVSDYYGDGDYSESRGKPSDSLLSFLQSFFGLRYLEKVKHLEQDKVFEAPPPDYEVGTSL